MLVGFAGSLGAAKTYASREHYEIDANRELLGLGAPISPPVSPVAWSSPGASRRRRSTPRRAPAPSSRTRGRAADDRHAPAPDRPVRVPARGHPGSHRDRRADRAHRRRRPVALYQVYSRGSAARTASPRGRTSSRPWRRCSACSCSTRCQACSSGSAVSLLLLLYRASRPRIAVLGRVPGSDGQFADIDRPPGERLRGRRHQGVPGGQSATLRQRGHGAGAGPRGGRARHPRDRARRRDLAIHRRDRGAHARGAARRPAPDGVRLLLRADVGQVRDVLRRTGADPGVTHVHPTVEEAVRAVAGDDGE